jgi:hypothetical protein
MFPIKTTLFVIPNSFLSSSNPLHHSARLKRQVIMRSKVGEPLLALQTGCVYLDWNATTPIFPEVAEAIQPYLTVSVSTNSTKRTVSIVASPQLTPTSPPLSPSLFTAPFRQPLFYTRIRNQLKTSPGHSKNPSSSSYQCTSPKFHHIHILRY